MDEEIKTNLPPLESRSLSLMERCWLFRRFTTITMITMTIRNTAMATHRPIYMVMFSLFSASEASESIQSEN